MKIYMDIAYSAQMSLTSGCSFSFVVHPSRGQVKCVMFNSHRLCTRFRQAVLAKDSTEILGEHF